MNQTAELLQKLEAAFRAEENVKRTASSAGRCSACVFTGCPQLTNASLEAGKLKQVTRIMLIYFVCIRPKPCTAVDSRLIVAHVYDRLKYPPPELRSSGVSPQSSGSLVTGNNRRRGWASSVAGDVRSQSCLLVDQLHIS